MNNIESDNKANRGGKAWMVLLIILIFLLLAGGVVIWQLNKRGVLTNNPDTSSSSLIDAGNGNGTNISPSQSPGNTTNPKTDTATLEPVTADEIINLTNQERAKLGLNPLQKNDLLTKVADNKAKDMFTNNYYANVSPAGKKDWELVKEAGYDFCSFGENLSISFIDVNEILTAWMASPKTRPNIINSDYKEIGVAVATGTYQGSQNTIVVQMFGADDCIRSYPDPSL